MNKKLLVGTSVVVGLGVAGVVIGKKLSKKNHDNNEETEETKDTDCNKNVFNGMDVPEDIKILTIPEGIEYIGACAFAYYSQLEEVRFPSTLRGIEEKAFEGCRRLKRVNLPEGTEYIDKYAFSQCPNLQYVSIPSTMEEIHPKAFLDSNHIYRVDTYAGPRKFNYNEIFNITRESKTTIYYKD